MFLVSQVSQWVSSPSNASSAVLGYTQWKPVAYRTAQPKFEDATPCRHSNPVLVSQLPPSGWVQAFFRDGQQTSALNITFSIAGDPFYNVTNYLSWWVIHRSPLGYRLVSLLLSLDILFGLELEGIMFDMF